MSGIVMNLRERLAETARQNGWGVEYGGTIRSAWLKATVQPEPDAPLGGPRHVIEVYFDVTAERFVDAYAGVGRPKARKYGGQRAVVQMLKRRSVE